MAYNFAVLDPRNIPAATEANDKVFANAVYGVEVTVPTLAKRCAFNLDPQHSGGDASRAAIEVALTAELPAEGTTLATVRADLDSIGAMAILTARAADGDTMGFSRFLSQNLRVNLVAAADKFARGSWPGHRALPAMEKPWPEDDRASVESSRPLAAIAAAVADFKVPIADRVAIMEKWLCTGEEPAQYRDSVEKERADMIAALEGGNIKWGIQPCRFCGSYNNMGPKLCADCAKPQTYVATVVSTHRAATTVGYHLAPVVVALNPEFRFQGGEPHHKFTVCQYAAGYVDIESALAELNEIEPGWGGSPTVGGSPQGVSSSLTIDQVVEVVTKHLK